MPVQGGRPTVKTRFSGLRNVLSGIGGTSQPGSSNIGSPSSSTDEADEPVERLTCEELVLTKVGRYGFPYQATCLALDPVQKILAIGTANGSIRLCGKPGVECHVRHTSSAAVVELLFLVNEGGLISACDDASIHLWNLRQAQPALIQSLRFNREKITCLRLPYTSKWLYVGTERGNIYMVCIESFTISGYVINWNKAIPISCKSHPGPVMEIDSNPVDSSKLVVTFENGECILWDLRSKCVQQRYTMQQVTQNITSTCWQMDGKQFISGHWDGSISVWNCKNQKKPDETSIPHSSKHGASNSGFCCPITKLMWVGVREGEQSLVIFSGGLGPGHNRRGLTLIRGRSKMLLLSDYVVDFVCLCETPWKQDFQDPQIIIALLKNEIVVFDLSTLPAPSLPWFDIPYTFNIHDSPITCMQYYPECPADLIPALHRYSSSKKQVTTGSSKQKWPLTGGELGEVSYEPSLLVTGHADGSCKFWDVSSNSLYLVNKLTVTDVFERDRSDSSSSDDKGSIDQQNDEPYAIQHLWLCTRSRVLAVATLSNFVIVYRFRTMETAREVNSIDVNFGIELGSECDESPTSSQPTTPTADNPNASMSSAHLTKSMSITSTCSVKSIMRKWSPGFQPEMVCQQIANEPTPMITCITLSSAYGLVAFGNAVGIALVDYVQKKLVSVMMTYEIGVLGDITETPPDSAKIQKVSSPDADFGDKVDPLENVREKKKERSSRFFGSLSETKDKEHPKLNKKPSQRSNGKERERAKEKDKDREDGIFSKDIPMAGFPHSLMFTYSYTRKGVNIIVPSLWIGTSTGSASVIALSMPSNGEQRLLQPVLAANTGTQVNLKSCILSVSLLDKNGCMYPPPFEFWKEGDETKASLSTLPTFTIESSERHYLVLVSERKIKVKGLPSLKTIAKTKLTDDSLFFIRADVIEIEGSSCIACLTSVGSLRVYSLLSLRVLMDNNCGLNTCDYRIFRTFRFGKGGEAVYLTSPTEIQRIALTKNKQKKYIEELGSLFTVVAAPEPPQKSFLQNIFSSTPSPVDRDELFGTKKVGTASKSVADRVPGSGIEGLRNNSDSVIGALAGARMALDERGEKLGVLQDRTAMMSDRASSFASAAQQLADKYQRKKWWQL